MDGMGSSTELLASVANPEFAWEAANEWCTAGEGLDSLCGDSRDSGDSDSGSSSSDGVASGGEEDDEDDDCSEPFDPLPIFDDDGEHLDGEGPPSKVGAVEAALRASFSKKTAQIFYPTPGLVFDSLEEAYEFYNLYSWEVGFGIRYGRSNTNKGNNYRTKQLFECGNAVGNLDIYEMEKTVEFPKMEDH
ncbi:hypothetical protein ACQ4PT_051376 [Festuca glaucescens]